MPASIGLRAVPLPSLPVRLPYVAACRSFHASPRRLNVSGAGGKPADNTAVNFGNIQEAASLAGNDASSGRSRGRALRTLHARRRTASDLPPVQLPPNFLRNNVFLHIPNSQPSLPRAFSVDEEYKKAARFFSGNGPHVRVRRAVWESYFETALSYLFVRESELALEHLDWRLEGSHITSCFLDSLDRLDRLWGLILDTAWLLIHCLDSEDQALFVYSARPFWWWHFHKHFDRRTNQFHHNDPCLSASLRSQLDYAEHHDYHLAHVIADIPEYTLATLQRSLKHDLQVKSPPHFDSRTCKRPITILSISGYCGPAMAESVAHQLAHYIKAHLVQLNAFTLSYLLGDYVGENWAYSRGALSMMGFRAAELNGKLPSAISRNEAQNDEEDSDSECSISSSQSLDRELRRLSKVRDESFGKWESLKIDKILEHIIRSPAEKSPTSSAPTLIHVHDFIELSMTLEGSALLGRLRSIIDAAWQSGVEIAMLGTSSVDCPSEDYENAVKNLAYNDLVVTPDIKIRQAEEASDSESNQAKQLLLEDADFFFENIQNINIMMQARNGHGEKQFIYPPSDQLSKCLRDNDSSIFYMTESILPLPEVYTIAAGLADSQEPDMRKLMELIDSVGSLRFEPARASLGEEQVIRDRASGQPLITVQDSNADGRLLRLNEYEKRIAAGQIHRDNLRVTFADIHVPKETVSALKLLTSLALVRPDAFSYGVLAQDKIPGCLLYGPPGTGKTMLAKAVAKESGANMLEISGATINDKWVGESEKLVRAVFTLAKRLSPCVVFIDEADALLANRSMFGSRPSNREHINQFLKEWDGMEDTNAFIMVATNRPFDLDDAVLRRLPRKILVDLPLRNDRAAILKLLLRGEMLDDSVSLDEFAERTGFYSGSDLKNVCVAAAMAAVEEENEAAARSADSESFPYPKRRTLRKLHFEKALKQIPASISEDMASLKMIRQFDEQYGNSRKGGRRKGMGFGTLKDQLHVDAGEVRIRASSNP